MIMGMGGALGAKLLCAVALAWHESRLSPVAVSRAGAVGAVQVMPWVLRAYGPDPVGAGMELLANLLTRHDAERAVCHYRDGKTCTNGGRRWARSVIRMARRLRAETPDSLEAVETVTKEETPCPEIP